MPLPVAVGNTAPPIRPPVLPTPVDDDAFLLFWEAPDGSSWPLTQPDLGWHTQDSLTGLLGAAPITITADSYDRGGSIVRHIQAQNRIGTLALRIDGPGHMDMLVRFRALAKAFAQTRRLGPGMLTLQRPDGSLRQIAAYYQEGFDAAPGNMSGWTYADVVLTLLCPDPYWTDPTFTTIDRQFSGDAKNFFSPFLSLTNAQTLGDTIVNNPGDVEAYPIWTIQGPTSGITATNNTTGQSFTIDPNASGISHGPLLSGEVVTVTTSPWSVRGPDGSKWTAALDFPTAVLWALQPGDNDVTVELEESGDGSAISMAFYARYETA